MSFSFFYQKVAAINYKKIEGITIKKLTIEKNWNLCWIEILSNDVNELIAICPIYATDFRKFCQWWAWCNKTDFPIAVIAGWIEKIVSDEHV